MMFSPLHNNTVSHAVKRRDTGPWSILINQITYLRPNDAITNYEVFRL